jgi:uncharacterized protein
MKTILCIATFLTAFPQIVNAASFECKKAKSELEKTICSTPQLDALDTKMGEAYRASIKVFPLKGFVQTTQKSFLHGTYLSCLNDGTGGVKGDSGKAVAACMKVLQRRIDELEIYQQAKIYTDSVGQYDAEGIVFLIYQKDGKTRAKYYGSWMPDAYRPAPFPNGHICDDDGEIKKVGSALVLDVGDQVPIQIDENKLVLKAFISCSPRTGISEGEYKRVK